MSTVCSLKCVISEFGDENRGKELLFLTFTEILLLNSLCLFLNCLLCLEKWRSCDKQPELNMILIQKIIKMTKICPSATKFDQKWLKPNMIKIYKKRLNVTRNDRIGPRRTNKILLEQNMKKHVQGRGAERSSRTRSLSSSRGVGPWQKLFAGDEARVGKKLFAGARARARKKLLLEPKPSLEFYWSRR